MPKKAIFFVSLILTTFFFSCKKEKFKSELSIDFQLQHNGSDANFNQFYSLPSGVDVKIELVKFYVSNVDLTNEKDESKRVEEILLFDLDETGKDSKTIKIPNGKYKKIAFGIGVPQVLNDTDPSEFNEKNHPLSTTQNTYWGMATKYRFVMIDGRYDLDGDGIGDGTFSYHTGFDESFRNASFSTVFSVDKKAEYKILFNIELLTLIENGASSLNVETESNYHGNEADFYRSLIISDNFLNSLSIK